MRKSILIVAALLGAVAVPAVAAEVEVETSVVVTYGDLDLTAPAGAAQLDARVESAAEKVCVKPDIRELKATQAFETCKAEARDRAMEQLSLTNPFDGMALASLF